MISKAYFNSGSKCRVIFHVPSAIRARTAHLCGDFNDWSTQSHPMERQPDGSFSLTLELDADQDYRFRYFIDGYCWFNDEAADAYVKNKYDNLESLVRLNNGINQ